MRGSNDALRVASMLLHRINISSKGQVWTDTCLLMNNGGSVLCVIQ